MLKQRMTLVVVLMVGLFATLKFGPTGAFFSNLEKSIGNLFSAAEGFEFDLLVNGQDDPPGIVNLGDLKPGDDRFVDKTVRVNSGEDQAKVFLHLKDLVASQGAQTEPEDEEENGIPQFNIQDFITYDLTIDGESFIDFEDDLLFPDAVSCWIPLGTISTNIDIPVQQSFHFDAVVTNWAQGDILTFVEDFIALSVDAPDPGVPYGSDRIWDPTTKTCQDCVIGGVWTASVVSSSQGVKKDNSAITDPNRTDPTKATGVADWVIGTGTNFFSLGKNGTITLAFATVVFDEAGPDISIHEATNGRVTYPEEKALVEVSFDGLSWFSVGTASSEPGVGGDGVMLFDISPTGLTSVKYVRLTETTDFTSHTNDSDGFDLDAVDGVNGCVEQEN